MQNAKCKMIVENCKSNFLCETSALHHIKASTSGGGVTRRVTEGVPLHYREVKMIERLIVKLISIPFILICLTVHEYAHGFVAYKLGDDTAKNSGRLTLSPMAHLDWLGALCMLLFNFGWAKPVPVNPYNFKKGGSKGIVWVSLAGPLSNLIFAFLIVLVYGVLFYTLPWARGNIYVSLIAQSWAALNVGLAVFNLVPVPPLDGSKVLMYFLPYDKRTWMHRNENMLYMALMLLAFSGMLSRIISPAINLIITGIYKLADLILFFLK